MKQNQLIEITVRRVYGMPVIYPACANAKFFAAIAGTKTITPASLRYIKALGFDVTERQEHTGA